MSELLREFKERALDLASDSGIGLIDGMHSRFGYDYIINAGKVVAIANEEEGVRIELNNIAKE